MNLRNAASLTAALTLALATLFTFGARPAHAQVAPFTAYGQGLTAGATVAAVVKGVTCGTATVDTLGNWLIQVASTSPCKPTTGNQISFLLNGQATGAAETWRAGGAPTDITNGIALVAGPDTTPPVVTAPAAISVTVAEGASGAPATTARIVTFLAAASAADAVDGAVSVSNDAPAQFPIGATTVTFSATDTAGNAASATSTVTVKESGGAGTFLNAPTGAGINPVLWNGGTVDQVVDAAGVGLRSMWIYEGGRAIGYTAGAPGFVNAGFLALFPDGEIPPDQIIVLVLG